MNPSHRVRAMALQKRNHQLHVELCFLLIHLPAVIQFHVDLWGLLLHRLLFFDIMIACLLDQPAPPTLIVNFLHCPAILMPIVMQSLISPMDHLLILLPVIVRQQQAMGSVRCLSLVAVQLILLLILRKAYM